jgi:hypothetical protein
MNPQTIKQLAIAAAISTALTTASIPSHASDFSLSEASGASIAAPIAIVGIGASAIFVAGGTLVVKSVQLTGQAIRVVVESTANAAATTLTFVGKSAEAFVAGVGDTLRVVPTATGIILYESRRAIAWVPNGNGTNLTHNERLTQ